MKKNYVPLCIFALFLLISSASAEVVVENTFTELGYTGFEVEGKVEEECASYFFDNPLIEDTPAYNLQYTVVSLHARFLPVEDKYAEVKVILNGDVNAAELGPSAFLDGWARIELPKEKLRERNSLRVCAKTTIDTNKIEILGNSIIGRYRKLDFPKEAGFGVHVSNREPSVNERFVVTVTLRNYGSEPADVKMRYRRQSLDERTSEFEIVSGDTSWEGTIGACEVRDENAFCKRPATVRFEYVAKIARAVQFTMLPAIVEYKNVFGEPVLRESNRVVFDVQVPEISVNPFFSTGEEKLTVGEINKLKLIVKNQGQDRLENIDVFLEPDSGLIVFGEEKKQIATIMPGEVVQFDVNVTAETAGEFNIGCKLQYLDYNVVESDCRELELEFEQMSVDIMVIGGVVLVLIGVLVYAYIQLK